MPKSQVPLSRSGCSKPRKWENGRITGFKYFTWFCIEEGASWALSEWGDILLHTPHSLDLYPNPSMAANPWKTRGNASHPTPAPQSIPRVVRWLKVPPGPRKVKGYLMCDTRQTRFLTLPVLGISISWTPLEPEMVAVFVLFYSFSVFLSLSSNSFLRIVSNLKSDAFRVC